MVSLLAKRTQLRQHDAMHTIPATKARAQLYRLIDAAGHEPVQITGKRGNAILVSESDWRSIQETLYLLSVPGMRASVRRGLKTPLSQTSKQLKW